MTTFNTQTWQEKAKEKLQQIQQWLPTPQETPTIVYGTIAGLTIWPLVETAVATGQLNQVLYATYPVLASLGTNLLANQIEAWKNSAKPPNEDEVIAWVRQQAAENESLHREFDLILQQFASIPQALAAINQANQAWFIETLRQELSQLGTLQQFNISGTAAIGDHATAVGPQGVHAGNVSGVIITGFVAGNIYNGPPPKDTATALRIYCHAVLRQCGRLPLRGLDLKASDPTTPANPLGLANVYIDLNTTQSVPKRGQKQDRDEEPDKPLPVLTAVAQNPRLVLLGAPGSGKTTFVHHLAYCLAQATLDPAGPWLSKLATWPANSAPFLPLLVTLRDFAATLRTPLPTAEPSHLWEFIKSRLAAQNLTFVSKPLHKLLEQGQVLLLLDGLDEVPTAAQRLFVRQAVEAFIGRYPQNRAVVTCRVLSYQPPDKPILPDLRLPGQTFPSVEIAPFSPAQIDAFIAAWYTELHQIGEAPAPGELITHLQRAVRRPDLRPLARNPLLLTAMALVHSHKGRLPDTRALLYESTIDLLLWQWEQIKSGDNAQTPLLRQLLDQAGLAETDFKRVLRQVAYTAHEQGGTRDDVADIDEFTLQTALAPLKSNADDPKGDLNWARSLIAAMKLRAGLLIERAPHLFAFPHRTFQEYLAGSHLASQKEFATQAKTLAESGPNWRVVILLAVGRLVYVNEELDKPLVLVGELCPAAGQASEQTWRNAWLAGEVLAEMGLKRVKTMALGRELLERVCHRLAQLVSQGHLPPRERMEVGDLLGQLGDPRPGVLSREPELIEIPAGPFLMGRSKYSLTLTAFAIAKYPVTNAQYRFFIEDGGYTPQWQTCWTEAGWNWLQGKERRLPYYWDDPANNAPNQPVVGVSWYEAIAYTRWLSQATGKPYRLPTEAEWERAARHTDGRSYPWGNDLIEDCANYKALGLGRPTAVGLFPKGVAQCGALDLVGNVWERCQSEYKNKPYNPNDGRENITGTNDRVLRGGAYYKAVDRIFCASRLRYSPHNDGWSPYGFRVCVPLELTGKS